LRLTEPLENVGLERQGPPAISRSSWLLASSGRSQMILSLAPRTLLGIMIRDVLEEGRITTKFSDRPPAAAGARGRNAPAHKVRARARAPAPYGSLERALYASRFAATPSYAARAQAHRVLPRSRR